MGLFVYGSVLEIRDPFSFLQGSPYALWRLHFESYPSCRWGLEPREQSVEESQRCQFFTFFTATSFVQVHVILPSGGFH